jgi:hypothetical protein
MTASIPIYAPLADRDEFPPSVRQEHAPPSSHPAGLDLS